MGTIISWYCGKNQQWVNDYMRLWQSKMVMLLRAGNLPVPMYVITESKFYIRDFTWHRKLSGKNLFSSRLTVTKGTSGPVASQFSSKFYIWKVFLPNSLMKAMLTYVTVSRILKITKKNYFIQAVLLCFFPDTNFQGFPACYLFVQILSRTEQNSSEQEKWQPKKKSPCLLVSFSTSFRYVIICDVLKSHQVRKCKYTGSAQDVRS